MVSLLIISAHAHAPEEKPSKDITPEQQEKYIKLCTQNLVAIGEAIQTYQQEQGDFPEWLSDLHPKYLADE